MEYATFKIIAWAIGALNAIEIACIGFKLVKRQYNRKILDYNFLRSCALLYICIFCMAIGVYTVPYIVIDAFAELYEWIF